jgi:protein YibB
MSDISIVTAFFDIGRGNWTQAMEQRGGPLPHYLERSNDTYIDRFSHLATLDNDLTIFTTYQFAGKIQQLRDERGLTDKTKVVIVDLNDWAERRAQIRAVMDDPEFPAKINPQQIRNPEYWSEDYVLVMSLKSHFVAEAIEHGYAKNDTVAWIDFGYCRDAAALGGATKWSYDFDPEKIHLFNTKDFPKDDPNALVTHAVVNNDPIILGAAIVANKDHWRPLSESMQDSLTMLINQGVVDDDQSLWLICYFGGPEHFELHPINYQDAFIVFRDFNDK